MKAGLNRKNIVFTREQVGELFPFHILFDEELTILQAGRLMEKLISFPINASLHDHFKIEGISGPLSYDILNASCNQMVYLESLTDKTSFKGSFYQCAIEGQLIFIGNIKPDDLMEKHSHSISIRDFPVHDSFNDYLFSERANKKAYEELQFLLDSTRDKVQEQKIFNEKLEQKVNERTAELLKSQEQLKLSLKKEIELSQLRSSFVSTASHQFRTPLAIIQSNSELLEMLTQKNNGSSKLKIDDATQRIRDEIRRMTTLMDDVLILDKINEGNLATQKTFTDLIILCKESCSRCDSIQRDGRKVNFQYKGTPSKVNVDEKLMSHALDTLLSNAFRHSKHKDPELHLNFEKECLKIMVRDGGKGIPKSEIHKLFEPFHTMMNAENTEESGLELAIVKEYVELNNAEIQVESELNHGTTFTITIPCLPAGIVPIAQ